MKRLFLCFVIYYLISIFFYFWRGCMCGFTQLIFPKVSQFSFFCWKFVISWNPLSHPNGQWENFALGLCHENTNDYNANYHYIILPQGYKEKKNVIITQWQKVTMTMIRDQLQRSNNKIWLSIKVIIRETPTITLVVSMRRNLTSVLTM